jgi:membrane protein insertase Oxa1/YidC/SpoIIIJ
MQRRMMMLMPVMFTFFMVNMPSGLVLYWLTSNVIGMAQQYITNRKADSLEPGAARAKEGEVVSKQRAEDGHTA